MIKVRFVTPDGLYKEVESSAININTTDGQRGILPNHMPIVLIINISRLETIENGKRVQYATGGGMLYFENNEATILVNSIESQDEIDIERAMSAKQRAEDRLSGKLQEENLDLKRASIALTRALNRINVSKY